MSACTECRAADAKYKCPKCYVRYCSVACCKLHKAKECETPAEPKDSHSAPQTGLASRAAQWELSTDSEDYVPPDKLDKLGESAEVKALLHNPHLRAILENLVNTEDTAKDMEAAMQEPIFVELADQCLKVVEGEGPEND